MQCEHNRKIGDNYGVSCQDCGAVLEGYGNGGWFGSNLKGHERCMHGANAWYTISDLEETCLYCQGVRERKHKAN